MDLKDEEILKLSPIILLNYLSEKCVNEFCKEGVRKELLKEMGTEEVFVIIPDLIKDNEIQTEASGVLNNIVTRSKFNDIVVVLQGGRLI